MTEITLRPNHVLLVDASDEVARHVRGALPADLFAVSEGRSADVSAGMLRDTGIDIVLLRLGSEPVAGAFRRALRTHPLAVVALLDRGESEEMLRAFEEDALDSLAVGDVSGPLLVRVLRYAMDRHRLEGELRRLAHVDPLTGLHNRRYVMKQLDSALNAARRHGHPLCLCVCDIDRFKDVNDRHGHLVGDEVLVAAARILAGGLRTEDVVGRFGGDEFCLLLPHVSAEEATTAVERIRSQLADLVIRTRDGEDLRISATFGMAQFDPHEHRDSQGLFHAADQALYRGKEAGRNRLAGPPD